MSRAAVTDEIRKPNGRTICEVRCSCGTVRSIAKWAWAGNGHFRCQGCGSNVVYATKEVVAPGGPAPTGAGQVQLTEAMLQRIAARKKALGYETLELAAKGGMDEGTLFRILQGWASSVSRTTLDCLANGLNTTSAWLLTGRDSS